MLKKTDTNQAEIMKDLRQAGATVASLHAVGRGLPDLLVGFRGENYLLEVKTDRGKLTQAQVTWHETWRGRVAVVHNA